MCLQEPEIGPAPLARNAGARGLARCEPGAASVINGQPRFRVDRGLAHLSRLGGQPTIADMPLPVGNAISLNKRGPRQAHIWTICPARCGYSERTLASVGAPLGAFVVARRSKSRSDRSDFRRPRPVQRTGIAQTPALVKRIDQNVLPASLQAISSCYGLPRNNALGRRGGIAEEYDDGHAA